MDRRSLLFFHLRYSPLVSPSSRLGLWDSVCAYQKSRSGWSGLSGDVAKVGFERECIAPRHPRCPFVTLSLRRCGYVRCWSSRPSNLEQARSQPPVQSSALPRRSAAGLPPPRHHYCLSLVRRCLLDTRCYLTSLRCYLGHPCNQPFSRPSLPHDLSHGACGYWSYNQSKLGMS